jgi:hypothetical protein
MTADSRGWELGRALFGSIPVYEEQMPEAAGGAGIVSPHVPVRKNSQQRARGQIGREKLNAEAQRRPRRREEIRR